MKHNIIAMRLPPALHDAYRGLSLDGRRQALESMRQALREACLANATGALPDAPHRAEHASAQSEGTTPEPDPTSEQQFPTDSSTQTLEAGGGEEVPAEPADPFPELIKSLSEGW